MMIFQIYANVMVMIFFSRPRDGDDDISNIRNCGGDDDVSNIRNYGGDDDVSNICNCGGDDDISNICNCGGDDDIDGDRLFLVCQIFHKYAFCLSVKRVQNQYKI